jgi:proline iminopeptidase
MSYINIRGVEHYYEWVSETSDDLTSKPTMVFMHGWAGSARYWRSTTTALLEQFNCLLYDLRGFGRSSGKSSLGSKSELAAARSIGEQVKIVPELSYELEEYAEDLAILLDELHLDSVYINAHSMGASIATLFFNRYPQKVKKGILTCSGVFEYDEKAFAAFHQFGGYVVKFRPKWLVKIPFADQMFMARFLHRPIPKSERQAFLQDFIDADYDTALGTIFTSVSKTQAEIMPNEFAKLTVPTLLVAGEYDKIIPADLGKRAAELSSQVEFVVIPQTSHFPMLEDPKFYQQEIRKFLEIS